MAAMMWVPNARAAQPQEISLINQAGISQPLIRRAQTALAIQVNHQLRRWWNVPPITFTDHGWPIYLLPDQQFAGLCAAADGGCHLAHGNEPLAFVQTDATGAWEQLLSHELLEMLVNPYGSARVPEICDPLEGWGARSWYTIDDFVVASFATPAFWSGAGQRVVLGTNPPQPHGRQAHISARKARGRTRPGRGRQ
jgi:hypothetical protein